MLSSSFTTLTYGYNVLIFVFLERVRRKIVEQFCGAIKADIVPSGIMP